jgi:hypothetical protein
VNQAKYLLLLSSHDIPYFGIPRKESVVRELTNDAKQREVLTCAGSGGSHSVLASQLLVLHLDQHLLAPGHKPKQLVETANNDER